MYFNPGKPCDIGNMGECFTQAYQVPLDNHCNYKYGGDTEWLVVADIDDYFVPSRGRALLEVLRNHDSSKVSGVGAVC
jgi:hypothetical protein